MSDVTEGGAGFDRDRVYPVLPLRDIVVFPGMIVPLFVGREKSVKALEEVMRDDKHILVVTQKNAQDDDPSPEEIYSTGTIASVLQLLKLPDGTVKVLVEGLRRATIDKYLQTVDYFEAEATTLPEPEDDATELEALARSAQSEFENYVKLNKKISAEVVNAVSQITDHSKLADTIASHLVIKIEQKEDLLGTTSVAERLQKILGLMEGEIGVLQVEKRIRSRVKRQMEKTQREYYLNEQMKAIQRELGDGEEGSNELAELEEKIKKTRLSREARQKADAELKKLKTMSPMSAEATVVRNYLDWLLTLPWGKKSKVKRDLIYAEKVLDEDHYGLEKVKERILEYLAVQSRTGKLKGPILCLVGPPGVGKTSLGKSIAKATGREFVRMALGGVRDEAEIRGHRRTYIGSMPGKVIQSLKKAGKSNPLFLLDEIDKMGQDFRGDPSSALLEVLDPEQNNTFNDHYLEVDYDLSDVMFVTTSNTLNIPAPLMDRMEIIRLSGYTEEEKFEIARRHLIPETLQENGLQAKEFVISDENLMAVVRNYTREAGVRNLKRETVQADAEGGSGHPDQEGPEGRDHDGTARGVSRAGVLPERQDRRRAAGRRGDGSRLDFGRRRDPDDRRRDDARQGPHDGDGQPQGSDEGIHHCRFRLRPVEVGRIRHQAAAVRHARHPPARAGRRDAEGWSVRGHRDGDRHHLADDRHPGAQRRGDDRRGDAAGQGAADRRPQGEAARSAPLGHQDGAHSRGEHPRSQGDPGERDPGDGDHPGQPDGRGAEPRPGPAARADRMEVRRR